MYKLVFDVFKLYDLPTLVIVCIIQRNLWRVPGLSPSKIESKCLYKRLYKMPDLIDVLRIIAYMGYGDDIRACGALCKDTAIDDELWFVLVNEPVRGKAVPSTYRSPLVKAVRRGDADRVRMLCSRGARVVPIRTDGFQPLFVAAQHNNVSVLRELCRYVKFPRALITPLIIAVSFGHVDMVEELCQQGINPNEEWEGATVFMKVCCRRYCLDGGIGWGRNRTLEILNMLIRAGGDINGLNKRGESVLIYMLRQMIFDELPYTQLIELGADKALRDREGLTARDIALHIGNRALATCLA
jgi:ankyrin repeat protein